MVDSGRLLVSQYYFFGGSVVPPGLGAAGRFGPPDGPTRSCVAAEGKAPSPLMTLLRRALNEGARTELRALTTLTSPQAQW